MYAVCSSTVMFHSTPGPPHATSLIVGSTQRIIFANSSASAAYPVASLCPACQLPYISLPRPQYFTLYGSGWPFFFRWFAQYVSVVALQYSTQSAASCIVPVPMFTVMYGSAPSFRQYSMNSSVPKWFDSSSCQAVSQRRERSLLGPMPSFQLYPDEKFPPGQRSNGT